MKTTLLFLTMICCISQITFITAKPDIQPAPLPLSPCATVLCARCPPVTNSTLTIFHVNTNPESITDCCHCKFNCSRVNCLIGCGTNEYNLPIPLNAGDCCRCCEKCPAGQIPNPPKPGVCTGCRNNPCNAVRCATPPVGYTLKFPQMPPNCCATCKECADDETTLPAVDDECSRCAKNEHYDTNQYVTIEL